MFKSFFKVLDATDWLTNRLTLFMLRGLCCWFYLSRQHHTHSKSLGGFTCWFIMCLLVQQLMLNLIIISVRNKDVPFISSQIDSEYFPRAFFSPRRHRQIDIWNRFECFLPREKNIVLSCSHKPSFDDNRRESRLSSFTGLQRSKPITHWKRVEFQWVSLYLSLTL